MFFLLAYLYVHYVIFLSMVMHMPIKLLNTFGNLLIDTAKKVTIRQKSISHTDRPPVLATHASAPYEPS